MWVCVRLLAVAFVPLPPTARGCVVCLRQNVTLDIVGMDVMDTPVLVTCFSSNDLTAANTPASPTAVVPDAPVKVSWTGQPYPVPGNSFCTFAFSTL